MSIHQNLIVVLSGVLMSFVLFNQGAQVNLETTRFGQIFLSCQAENLEYESCFVKRAAQIRNEYGASYAELESRKNRQMIFLVIPCIVLIVALFVGFAASGNEKYLTVLTLAPLFLSFLRLSPYAPEKWLSPFYIIIAAGAACLISHVKRVCFSLR